MDKNIWKIYFAAVFAAIVAAPAGAHAFAVPLKAEEAVTRLVFIGVSVLTAAASIVIFLALRYYRAKRMSLLLLEHTANLEYEYLVAVSVRDKKLNVLYSGSNTSAIYSGGRYDDIICACAERFLAKEDRGNFLHALDFGKILKQLETSGSYSYACFFRRDEGRMTRKMWMFSYLDKSKKIVTMTRRDISEQFAADLDPLTGLYRREKFNAESKRIMNRYPDTRFVVSICDLDRFKAYNDLFGEEAGDRLLIDIADMMLRLRSDVQPCVVGRLEADRFSFCCPFAMLKKIVRLHEVSDLLEEKHPEFRFTMRAGIYIADDPSLSVSIMCDRAQMALRSIKGKDSQHEAFYNKSMRNRLLAEQQLIGEMRGAFENDQFAVYLQPQVNMATGAVVGAEALARWIHPQRGVVAPAVFVPVLERRGHIMKLDRIIWEKTCALLAGWKKEGLPMIPVSVNISRADAANPHLCDVLTGLIEKYSLEPRELRLEITESAYLDNPRQIIAAVKKLREAGFFVEMDDFGSGSSSLNTLKDVSTDLLKLDMKFLSPDDRGSRSGIILNSVVSMAHWLKVPVLAEGVETVFQADYLKTIGCVLAQGYLYAKPMPPDEFQKVIAERGTETFIPAETFSSAFFNNEEFWDPQAQTTLIFNNFVGAAGIFEYSDGKERPTRINDRVFEMLHLSRADSDAELIFSRESVIEADRAAYAASLEKASAGDAFVHAEVRVRIGPYRKTRLPLYISVRMRAIAKRSGSCIIYASLEDIPARKTMEEKLMLSSEELRAALANMGSAVCCYDLETRDLSLSPEYAKKHNDPPVLKNIPYGPNHVADADRDAYNKFYEAALRGEPSGAATVRIANGDGSYAWEKLTFSIIKNDEGRAVRAVVSIEDITEQMDREAVNQRNKILVERMGTSIFDYDVMQDVLHFQTTRSGQGVVTRTYAGYYDFIPESALVAPESREELRRLIDVITEKPQEGSFDYRADNWGTGFCWSRLNYVSIADASGRVYRIVGHIENIEKEKSREKLAGEYKDIAQKEHEATVAARREAEQSAKDLEKEIVLASSKNAKRIMDMSPSYIYLLDGGTREIVFANAAARKNSGMDEICGKCYSVIMEQEAPCEKCPLENCGDAPSEGEELHRPDGTWAIAHAAPILWMDRRLIMVVQTDITQLKAAEAALRSKTRDLNLIVKSVPGGIFKYSAGPDEQFVYVSRTMLDMLGYTRREFNEKFQNRFSQMVYEKDRERVLYEIDTQIEKSAYDFCEYRIETKDGALKWVHDVGHIVTDEAGKKWFYVVIVDISQRVKAEEELRLQNEENRIVIRHSCKEVIRYNITQGVAEYTQSGAAVLGLPTRMENYPQSLFDRGIIDPESEKECRQYYEDMKNGVKTGSNNSMVRMPSGGTRWYHSDYTIMDLPEGKENIAIISFFDNSAMIEKELAYSKWQSKLAGKLRKSAVYLEVNLTQDEIERTENTLRKVADGESFSDYISRCGNSVEESGLSLYREFFDRSRLLGLFYAGAKEDNFIFRGKYPDAGLKWTRANVQMVKYPYSDDVKAFIVYDDIDESQKKITELAERASHDPLTNLLNRDEAERCVAKKLSELAEGQLCAAFMVDLDNFKNINDHLGHISGDKALVRAADVMRSVFRQDDIIARVGGDEFFIFIAGPIDGKAAAAVAERLVDAMRTSYGTIQLSAGAGAVIAKKEAALDYAALYAAADKQLYDSKRRGKNRYSIGEES